LNIDAMNIFANLNVDAH